MAEPGDAPGLVEIARGWARRLANTEGVNLTDSELEAYLLEFATAARAPVEAALDAATRRFTALYSESPIGVVLADPEGKILDVNPAFTQLLGYSTDDLAGEPLTGLAATDDDADTIRSAVDSLRVTGRSRRRERADLEHTQDGPVRTQVTIAALSGDTPGTLYPVLMVEDVGELTLLREALRKQNVLDALTGLPNAGSFVNKLETTLASGGDDRLALVYLDIDGFRIVNDGLGPGAGDEVLRHVATKLAAVFDRYDGFVARLSGDGFAVLLHGRLDTADVVDLVEEAMAELAEPVYVDGRGIGISLSAGIVVADTTTVDHEDLHRAAEITLHRAKENGRAQWMLYEPELDRADRRRYSIGAAIGGAIENGQFELEYEPTVKLDGSDEIVVVNAAPRWNHPEHGVLGPRDFYPMADLTGMAPALGRLLLTQAMSDAAAWYREFAEAPDLCVRLPIRLAIDPNLVGIVHGELHRTQLPPGKLRVCTDAMALLDRRGEVLEALSVLSELEVKIALAVSGAADLELVHTHRLPVGFAIVAGPLVEALASDGAEADGARRHLGTLVARARELGIERIGAEGVRNTEHAARLREIGVVAGRGKLFGDAVSGDEIRSLIAGRR
ncbi:diguanylate cyclase (GGDEF)-like protein/PAS domain S-box-containing protein [Saccharomonospora amisosensis]|uniref:Diguanylate cyclase (GGDEF)-like protein/PAS domain S-box-containing protein n=1 Tax=Saccharomonospora amisosensis TaxID=1128677 RepID=A0A7X5UPH3_9PSEU|nr:diguanylate cyclase [Saccharomonospora amisosensis]NIJ11780.1 diguanylate cyclase (GGDEF)-like protein/PAS domain S-box-containing protein [Saccharomonospora amisosensis]